MNAPTIAEAPWREIYPEAQTFFNSISKKLPNYDGFKILNGPPIVHTPCLFIGYQPGGSSDDSEQKTLRKSEKHWPATCEYATKRWTLAVRMQKMFPQQFLAKCVGMNAIFLRSRRIDDYKSDVKTMRDKIEGDRDSTEGMAGQRKSEPNFQSVIEEFCFPRVVQIIEAIDPLKIAVIGLETLKLKLFEERERELKNEKGYTLTRFGDIAGRRVIAFPHPSSARGITDADWRRIGDRILAWDGN